LDPPQASIATGIPGYWAIKAVSFLRLVARLKTSFPWRLTPQTWKVLFAKSMAIRVTFISDTSWLNVDDAHLLWRYDAGSTRGVHLITIDSRQISFPTLFGFTIASISATEILKICWLSAALLSPVNQSGCGASSSELFTLGD
jgi:hypothetical protein